MLVSPNRVERNDALQQLRSFIDSGGYAPGDRLPAERELIDQLGISRRNLRKGLDALEREGTIWRHVGKGTFVSNRDNQHVASLAELSDQVSPVQMMRARLSLEPAIAREAAANASAGSVNRIRAAHEHASKASAWTAYETGDDAFHKTIAEATGNILLCSLFDHLNLVRRAVAWQQVTRKTDSPPEDHPSFAEHEAIVAAIAARDPVAAHGAMRAHLNSVFTRLFGDS